MTEITKFGSEHSSMCTESCTTCNRQHAGTERDGVQSGSEGIDRRGGRADPIDHRQRGQSRKRTDRQPVGTPAGAARTPRPPSRCSSAAAQPAAASACPAAPAARSHAQRARRSPRPPARCPRCSRRAHGSRTRAAECRRRRRGRRRGRRRLPGSGCRTRTARGRRPSPASAAVLPATVLGATDGPNKSAG